MNKPNVAGQQNLENDNSVKRNQASHLPRLQTPPEWPSKHNLNLGKLSVVPPVKPKKAFVREKEKDVVNFKTSLNLNQQQEFPNSVIGIPMVSYGQHGSFISSDNGILYPYPPVVYPVPMCMNSARVLPPIQNPTGYHMGSSDKRFLSKNEAAICIQKYFRGWKVRKSLQIPNDDVPAIMNRVAVSVYYTQDELVNRGTDPLLQICQEITNQVVNEMAEATVQSTIKTEVHNHMTLIRSADWLEGLIIETIEPMIYSVAISMFAGYKYEKALDDIIDEVISAMMNSVIMVAWTEVTNNLCDLQITEISRFSEGRLFDSLFLDHFLGHLSGNNLSLYFRDYKEQTMDGVACGVLLEQFILVHNTSGDTLTNNPLQEYHHKTYCDMALDVVINELCSSLDEAMKDLQEDEKLAV